MNLFDPLLIAIQVGLIYVPLIFGIYVNMGVLSLPDFTMQGSFGIGGATGIVLQLHGWNPLLALLAAVAAGAATGLVTAAMHLWLRLNVLLASILVAAGAYSVALVVMGAGNLALGRATTIFDWVQDLGLTKQYATILTGALVAVVLGLLLAGFLRTRYGVSLVATGQNIQTARGLGIRTESRQAVGLAIGNGLAAASGALIVQNQRFMDVTIANGIIVIGLAGMMIGLSVVRSTSPLLIVTGLLVGVIVYRYVVSLALQAGADPNLLQLITAVLVMLVVWLRHSGGSLPALATRSGRTALRTERVRYYEEDRVASFL